jgi:hypothetical protein
VSGSLLGWCSAFMRLGCAYLLPPSFWGACSCAACLACRCQQLYSAITQVVLAGTFNHNQAGGFAAFVYLQCGLLCWPGLCYS